MAAAIRVYPELRRACRELRGVHPELRTVYAELRRTSIFSRLVSLSECLYAVSRSVNCAKLDRQTPELERIVSRRKQTAALCSNRQNFRFCLDEISTPLSSVGAREPSFLPGATTAQCRLGQGTALAVPSLVCPGEARYTQPNYSFCADSPARAVVSGLNLAPAHIERAPFLTGSASQTEFAATHSKQTTEKFLTGARTAFKQTENARSAHRFSRPAAPRNTGRGPRGTTSDQTASAPLPSPPPHAYVRLIANSMPARGKFIVLEGIDGSGKRTQLDMLARAFASRNVRFAQISFPRYDGFFGKLAARYLNGEFGSLEAVDAHFSALLYAGDRFEAKPAIESDLASGKTLLADRYIGSNLAHQGARVPREKRTEFLQWLRQLEYQVYALPAEDLVIYLRVPPAEAHRLIGEKGARDYTKLQRDIQESNLAHLESTSEVYDQLAQQPNWLKIECYDAAANALRAPESIHQEILAAVQAHVTPTLRANK